MLVVLVAMIRYKEQSEGSVKLRMVYVQDFDKVTSTLQAAKVWDLDQVDTALDMDFHQESIRRKIMRDDTCKILEILFTPVGIQNSKGGDMQ